MFCPQCGTESSSGQPYCRSCGSNLKVIGKAVTLSEAIARSDRGPMPKIKEMVKSLKVEHVSEEISTAFEQVNAELARSSADKLRKKIRRRRQKTPEQRRERLMVKGTTSLFTGAGLTLFLYFMTSAVNLHLPADVIANIPFEVDPVVRVLWLVGFVPMFAGLGRLLASRWIKVGVPQQLDEPAPLDELPPPDTKRNLYEAPASVTDRTTNILNHVNR